MKTITLIAAALAASLGTQAWAEAPKMKMSTPVPEGIATPDKLETSIGTLTSVDGVPDAETTQKVFDNLDLNRATEAFLNGIPIASMYALKHGLLKHGPANTTAVLFEELMDSKALWLTPNTTSVYMASWLAADRPTFPGCRQQQGRQTERRWVLRHLLRSEGTRGSGEQLDPDRPKQGVEHHPPPVWSA